MNFCQHCGARLPEGARFCTKCGRLVSAIGAPSGTVPPESEADPPTVAMQPVPHPTMTQPTFPVTRLPVTRFPVKVNRTVAIMAALVAIVLIAGGTTAFLAMNRDDLATCIIGSWRTTSYIITATDAGDTTTTTVTGLRLQFKNDGSTQQYFADVSTQTNDGDAKQLSGTVTFKYTVDGDTIAYANGRAEGMSEPGWDIDYTERADCSATDLTLTGTLDRDGLHSDWTTKLTRE
jgi:hypothetical protein